LNDFSHLGNFFRQQDVELPVRGRVFEWVVSKAYATLQEGMSQLVVGMAREFVIVTSSCQMHPDSFSVQTCSVNNCVLSVGSEAFSLRYCQRWLE
jgi:hypothetical protein